MGDRLVVGQATLDRPAEVRILVPQPFRDAPSTMGVVLRSESVEVACRGPEPAAQSRCGQSFERYLGVCCSARLPMRRCEPTRDRRW